MTADTSPYRIIDRRFRHLIQPSAKLDHLATGFRWAEGPVWFADHQVLLFSDIPNERMMRLTWDGQLSIFRPQSHYSNGHTRDRQGRLVSCQHGTRSVTRTEVDGTITTLADRFRGKRLNSPNDVVVRSDNSIWVTDPSYGILGHYEGFKSTQEQAHRNVFRLDPATGALTSVVGDFVQPNGLAFSPDESLLYVADSGASHDPDVPAIIRAFRVQPDNTLKGGEVFAHIDAGIPDGIRVDSEGNLWSSAADGIHCFAPDGTLIGKILVPETVANLTFGGPRRNRLFITATTSVYAIYVDAVGAA